MREQVLEIIKKAATASGLPEDRVFNLVRKDNLTIERPRIELQFLPETYRRTGRKLAATRGEKEITYKTELYAVDMEVAANVLAEDEKWLADFNYKFAVEMPRGFNDKNGNWVKIRIRKATFGRPPDIRVGDSVIEVFKKASQLFSITFTYRITETDTESLIPSFRLNPEYREAGVNHGNKKTESERQD